MLCGTGGNVVFVRNSTESRNWWSSREAEEDAIDTVRVILFIYYN